MRPVRVALVILGIGSMFGTVILSQQHSYTQADIDAGSKIYDNSCGGCHGENGDKVVGVDFSKGVFKTARSDEDLIRIIRNGVPNTAMPSNPLSEAQTETAVAYVRSLLGGAAARPGSDAPPIPGDAARGKAIFEGKGNCATCHAIGGAGGRGGPDLAPAGGRGGGNRGAALPTAAPAAGPANPGAAPARGGGPPAAGPPAGAAPPAQAAGQRGGGGGGGGRGGGGPNPQQLQRSILDPNAEIAPAYRVYQVVPKNGAPVRGTLLNQDTFSLQLRDTNEKLAGFLKQDLKEFGFMPSTMPSYKDTLTAQEVADIVSYLISVRSN